MLKASLLFVIVFLLLCLCLTGCKAPKNLAYFQQPPQDAALQQTNSPAFERRIRPDDELAIGILSASPEQSSLFTAVQNAAGTAGGSSGSASHRVDENGNIQLYKLGNISVTGLTAPALQEKLQEALSLYLKDPVVRVRFENQRIIVLGEVARPGVVPMPAGQMTLLEALGHSGDLTVFGTPDNILVIRRSESGKVFVRLSLLDHAVFSSPFFQLQSEDVVYVAPQRKRKVTQQVPMLSYILSGISILSAFLIRVVK